MPGRGSIEQVSGATLNHEKSVSTLHFIPFHLQELVIIEKEFEDCESCGRATNTPVYHITNVRAYGSLWLENGGGVNVSGVVLGKGVIGRHFFM